MHALRFQLDKCLVFYLHTTRRSSLHTFATTRMDPALADEEVEGAAGDDGLAYLWRGDI